MNNIVLSSSSIRLSHVIEHNTHSSEVIKAASIRASMVANIPTIGSETMANSSLPIAGYNHPWEVWEEPKKMDYTVIHN